MPVMPECGLDEAPLPIVPVLPVVEPAVLPVVPEPLLVPGVVVPPRLMLVVLVAAEPEVEPLPLVAPALEPVPLGELVLPALVEGVAVALPPVVPLPDKPVPAPVEPVPVAPELKDPDPLVLGIVLGLVLGLAPMALAPVPVVPAVVPVLGVDGKTPDPDAAPEAEFCVDRLLLEPADAPAWLLSVVPLEAVWARAPPAKVVAIRRPSSLLMRKSLCNERPARQSPQGSGQHGRQGSADGSDPEPGAGQPCPTARVGSAHPQLENFKASRTRIRPGWH